MHEAFAQSAVAVCARRLDRSTRRLFADTDSNRRASAQSSHWPRIRTCPDCSTRTGRGTGRPSDSGVIPFAQPFGFILSEDSLCAALGVWHCSAFSCCSARLVRLSDAACVSVSLPVSFVACSGADRGALCAVVLTSPCFRFVHTTIGTGNVGVQTPPAPAPRDILSRRYS